jgi:phage terminase small subunit
MGETNIEPPEHLSPDAKAIWRGLMEEYDLGDTAGQRILQVALEAFDRAQACREQIEREGMTWTGKLGQPRPHVLLPIERDNRAASLAGIRNRGLDLQAVKPVGRPPRGY